MNHKNTEIDKTQESALVYAKCHKKEIVERRTSLREYPAILDMPFSLFMGGSPGAGKTEIATRLTINLEKMHVGKFVRIDADELRTEFPDYCGANAALFQQAATRLVHEIHSAALKRRQHFIMDGTFSNLQTQTKNIARSLKRGRWIGIFYVYQSPEAAWRFVQMRKKIEGRGVPAEAFVEKYIESRKVANEIKRQFGDAVHLHLVVKNGDGGDKFRLANIDSIDKYVPKAYNEAMLLKIIGDK